MEELNANSFSAHHAVAFGFRCGEGDGQFRVDHFAIKRG